MRHRIKWLLTKLPWLPDEPFLRWAYRLETGQRLNLTEPVTFCDKLNWLKLYGDTERYAPFVDKYAVRDIVARVAGPQYLIHMVGLYARAQDIPWDMLPERFVVKCTHGSHCGIAVTDKARLHTRDAAGLLNKWLHTSWYRYGREPPYRGIKPRVMIEEMVADDALAHWFPPIDYKFMCFHGEPRIVQLHRKFWRDVCPAPPPSIDFYSKTGERLDMRKAGFRNGITAPGTSGIDRDKLADMLPLARKLARATGAPYVRVDLYHERGQAWFSEITFFDSAGFRLFLPVEANVTLGEMIRLEEVDTCPS